MPFPRPIPLPFAVAIGVAVSIVANTAWAGGVALMPDGVLTPAERDDVVNAVRDAGHTLLEDSEVVAAVEGARAACAHDDVECLARVALLADAEVVVSFARRAEEIDVVAVDAGPRVGRAVAPAANVARAVLDAISSRAAHPPTPPPPPEDLVATTTTTPATTTTTTTTATPTPTPTKPITEGIRIARTDGGDVAARTHTDGPDLLPLAGAGLAGAGIVALVAGGYAAVLASDSIAQAESARFQDDSARFGDTANGQIWLSAGAFTIGAGAMAGGAALVFLGGDGDSEGDR